MIKRWLKNAIQLIYFKSCILLGIAVNHSQVHDEDRYRLPLKEFDWQREDALQHREVVLEENCLKCLGNKLIRKITL